MERVREAIAQPLPPPPVVWEEMMRWGDNRLYRTDPAVLNLSVAKGIPALADMEIEPYCHFLDQAAANFARWLPQAEQEFFADPERWENDLVMFRLGMLCQFIHKALGVTYNEDQRDVKKIRYTNPGDLFLNGVIETRRGTCGNMADLFHCLAWRLRWPVYLAMSRWHSLCRYDDGERKINIETSNFEGGFRTPPDEHYMREDGLLPFDIEHGSDLTDLTPRQTLGCYYGARGRYWYDQADATRAEADYARAARLFPQSRLWRQKWQYALSLKQGARTGAWAEPCLVSSGQECECFSH
jgi:hypothetical protein